MKILLLHLSDIHFRSRTDKVLSQASSIAATAISRIHSAEAVYVVASGDIAYSGNREQYEIASAFFEMLRSALTEETDSPIHFILAPGNHDCDFSADQSVRQALISNVLQKDGQNLTPEIIDVCVKVQSCFFEFRNTWGPEQKSIDDPLWVTYPFDIGGYRVVFDCLNVAWMSQLKEEQGKLVFPVHKYEHLKSESAHIRVAIMHHPLNWYNQATYRPFRKLVRTLAQIVITGHEHEQNVGENIDAESEQSTYVEGGVLQAHDHNTPPSFNLIELDLDEQKYACELHTWDGTLFAPQEVAAWQDYRLLPKKRRNELILTDEFNVQLDDPGGAFSHPGKQKITLSDIYVFPDLLHRSTADQKTKDTISSGTLRDINLLEQGVLLKGDEKSGKTSLIYQLFRHFYDSGYAPLLLQGTRLKPTVIELNKCIDQSIVHQYGKDAVNKFRQTPTAQKVAFVDDFDLQKLTNSQRAEILKMLQADFRGLVLTVSDLFEMDEVINEGSIHALIGFKEYTLLEFGHKLRFELIRKWSSLGAGSGRDSNDIFNMLDQAEKSLNAIIGRNLIPRVPIYLLTLLQSLELGQTNELQNSAYGDCYRYLITGALARANVKPIEMTEYLQFCTFLSWEYCKTGEKELDSTQLSKFNEWFSGQYYKRGFNKRIDLLINCKILVKRGEYYSFRYPYIYYYFLGKYLSDNLQEITVRDKVSHYCKHLYVRDYANSVLFLAHHSRDSFVYEKIVEVLRGLFSEKCAIEFNGDTQLLSNLVESAPKLVFNGGEAIDNRRDAREMQDKVIASEGDVIDSNSEEESLSLLSKLTLVFKTVEILGQILKNQYATIPNYDKKRLMNEAFNGPLRALKHFFDFISTDHEIIISEIERFIAEKDSNITDEKRNKIAKNAVCSLISAISYGTIYKTALSIGSEHLRETISEVSEENNSDAYRLIELSVKLESQAGIPFKLISKLNNRVKSNTFGSQILQRIVLNYLYMFKTRDSDKQKLCSELGISMHAQRAIDLRAKSIKRLK